MGYYYAKHEGLDDDIACGIKEHYLPKFSGDVLPETETGRSFDTSICLYLRLIKDNTSFITLFLSKSRCELNLSKLLAV